MLINNIVIFVLLGYIVGGPCCKCRQQRSVLYKPKYKGEFFGSNCTMNDGQVTYCEKGCCEHQDYKYCCPLNATTIAEIIVGSAIGVGVLIFAIGVCIICSRRKSNHSASPSIFDVNADYQRLMEREANDSNFPNTYM